MNVVQLNLAGRKEGRKENSKKSMPKLTRNGGYGT